MASSTAADRENVLHLLEHGPTAVSELPLGQVHLPDKQAGVWTFKVHSNGQGGGGRPTSVAYLPDEHGRPPVVRAWLDANPAAVDANSRTQLKRALYRQGRQWRDAVEAVLDEWYDAEGGDDDGE